MKVTGYDYHETGASGFWFYKGPDILCQTQDMLLPDHLCIIRDKTGFYESQYDLDNTLFPGISRKVMNRESGEEAWRIVYRDRDLYEIQGQEETIEAVFFDGEYIFTARKEEVARMALIEKEKSWIIKDPDQAWKVFHAYWNVTVKDGISEAVLTQILTFPQMRFAF